MIVKRINPLFEEDMPISIEINDIRHSNLHYHPNTIEFLYCFSGKAEVLLNNEHHYISQGDLIAIEHEDIHCIFSNCSNIIFSVHVNPNNTSYCWNQIKYYFYSCTPTHCRPYQRKTYRQICNILLYTVYMHIIDDESIKTEYQKISNKLIQLLVDNFCWFTVEGLTVEENNKFSIRLNDVLKYVQDNYQHKITLSSLAKMEYINENYFSQFLKRTPLHSFTLMLNYVRCLEAERILLNSEMKVEEISDMCGFSSKKYLHKYFKFFFGKTPLQFKKWCWNYAKTHDEKPVEKNAQLVSSFMIRITKHFADDNL